MEGEKFIRKLLESFKEKPPMFLRSTESEKKKTRNLVEKLEGVFNESIIEFLVINQ